MSGLSFCRIFVETKTNKYWRVTQNIMTTQETQKLRKQLNLLNLPNEKAVIRFQDDWSVIATTYVSGYLSVKVESPDFTRWDFGVFELGTKEIDDAFDQVVEFFKAPEEWA